MRTGIYIDFDNIASNRLGSIQFSPLRRYYESSGNVTQAHAYLAHDETREAENQKYAAWRRGCRARLENAGFEVHLKVPKVYQSPDGVTTSKANVDVDLTVDVMLHRERLDRVILMTGDGDFVRLVITLKDVGIWVEVAAIAGLSRDLASACDRLTNPLLIPDVVYSPEISFRRIFKVVGFDLTSMEATVEYLEGAPKTLSGSDPAWRREKRRISREMYESRRFKPGKILGWTGADGLSAYVELA